VSEYQALLMPKTTTKSIGKVQQDRELLQNEPEVSLFISCLVMVNQLRGLERAFKGGEFNLSAFLDKSNAVLSQLTETVSATERFDIVFPVMDYGQFSPFFWRWFNWWDDYFKGLNPAQISHIERLARERAQKCDDYRPEEHWLAYRHTPAFTLVPT
jgi:hypothetical protein